MRATWFTKDNIPNLPLPSNYYSCKDTVLLSDDIRKDREYYIKRAVELGAKVYTFEMEEQCMRGFDRPPKVSYFVIHKDCNYGAKSFMYHRRTSNDFYLHESDKEIYNILVGEYQEEEKKLRRFKMAREMLK